MRRNVLFVVIMFCFVILKSQNSFSGSVGLSVLKDKTQTIISPGDIRNSSYKWFGITGSLEYELRNNSGISCALSTRTYGRSVSITSSLGTIDRAKYGFQIGLVRLSTFHSFAIMNSKLFLSSQVGINYANIIGDKGGEMKGLLTYKSDSLNYWTYTHYRATKYFLIYTGISIDYKLTDKIKTSIFYAVNSGFKNIYVMDIQYSINNDFIKTNTQTYNGTYTEFGIKVNYRFTK